MSLLTPRSLPLAALALAAAASPALAENPACAVEAYEFAWRGQIAGFTVTGRFSYDASTTPANGIVREQDLIALDVSFYDPQGVLLRTYEDNQDPVLYPTVNFAFDTLTKQLLQDGTWDVDDNGRRAFNGFMMGVGNPDLRSEPGSQIGLAFWSRPKDDSTPHIHVDDWDLSADVPGAGEFGFPLGFSSHEDVAFPFRTTQNRVDDGRVGEAYFDAEAGVNNLATDLDDSGSRVRVRPAERSALDLRDRLRCRFGD